FQYVLQDSSFGELLVGGAEPTRFEHVFASIQSVASSGLVERLGVEHFRHVVIDECHHTPAASYQKIIPALRPAILVGLTATPERTDGKSLLPDFDNHVAAELRLWHALDDQLLVPFEYYGISDGVNLRSVRWSRTGYDAAELGELYTGNDARANLIRVQLARRVNDVRAIRALGFCVSVAHAELMAARFTAAGIPALAVHGTTPSAVREHAPARLRARDVNVLFTCDLYNEGVDLPFVDTLLLLRPTASATVFLQQLGRGLRHAPGKSSCLVLDFIGQHREEFRFDATLAALTGITRAQLRKAVEQGFPYLPSGCALQLDGVARDQILASLRSSVGGAKRLAEEVRELASAGAPPTLADFLDATGRELADVYGAGGWTTIKRRADLAPPAVTDDEEDLSRRLGWLAHVDDASRLETYASAITAASSRQPLALSPLDRTRLQMLDFQLTPRGVMRAAEETAAYVARSPAIAREFEELRSVLDDRVSLATECHPVVEWPLSLH
ncbi:MAG TPA: DEAD/DEAH box helicase, partial [Kofleriaceae bacterium]|nr:DEAD/DEAH box helicase [Kofleriaceae bacterium]